MTASRAVRSLIAICESETVAELIDAETYTLPGSGAGARFQ